MSLYFTLLVNMVVSTDLNYKDPINYDIPIKERLKRAYRDEFGEFHSEPYYGEKNAKIKIYTALNACLTYKTYEAAQEKSVTVVPSKENSIIISHTKHFKDLLNLFDRKQRNKILTSGKILKKYKRINQSRRKINYINYNFHTDSNKQMVNPLSSKFIVKNAINKQTVFESKNNNTANLGLSLKDPIHSTIRLNFESTHNVQKIVKNSNYGYKKHSFSKPKSTNLLKYENFNFDKKFRAFFSKKRHLPKIVNFEDDIKHWKCYSSECFFDSSESRKQSILTENSKLNTTEKVKLFFDAAFSAYKTPIKNLKSFVAFINNLITANYSDCLEIMNPGENCLWCPIFQAKTKLVCPINKIEKNLFFQEYVDVYEKSKNYCKIRKERLKKSKDYTAATFYTENNGYKISKIIFYCADKSKNYKKIKCTKKVKNIETGTGAKCIVQTIFELYCDTEFNNKPGCIIKHKIYKKIDTFYELPLFLDLIFRTQTCNHKNNNVKIKQTLLCFLGFSIMFIKNNDDENQEIRISETTFIKISRILILRYLQIAFPRKAIYLFYSHAMLSLEIKKITQHQKNIYEVVLYLSFIIHKFKDNSIGKFNFLYSKVFNLMVIIEIAAYKNKEMKQLRVNIFNRVKFKQKFLDYYNNYIADCFEKCGIPFKKDFIISYRLLINNQIFLTQYKKSKGKLLKCKVVNFYNLILKCMKFYGKIVKRAYSEKQ